MVSDRLLYEEEVKKRELQRKNYLRHYNTQAVLFMAGEYDLEVKRFGDDHMQLKKGARVLSFYPGTEKGIWVSNPKFAHLTRKGFRIKNIEKFVKEEFAGEEAQRPAQAAPPPVKTKQETYGDCICGGHYVKRTNNTSKSAFLGCSNYPKCKRTKQIFINKTN